MLLMTALVDFHLEVCTKCDELNMSDRGRSGVVEIDWFLAWSGIGCQITCIVSHDLIAIQKPLPCLLIKAG